MPLGPGVQRTSSNKRPSRRLLRIAHATTGVFLAATFAVTAQLAPSSPAVGTAFADETAPPKAVFIVGPAHGATDSYLVDAEKMAVQAETVGMDVRRIFWPHATWDNVLANIQNASLVVYMGHGYGWPSPYTKVITESRQNGMGLNTTDGSGRAEYTYYGATPIKANVHLAPNAVVILVHGCYTAGNGEPGMAKPGPDVARQRVDNFASGFLAAGARAVFAFAWNQKVNYPNALATGDKTMDQIFMTPASGKPDGYVGWNDQRYDSVRTPGATNHLDPHPTEGYYRAVSGYVGMTAADWRAGAAGVPYVPPPPSDPADPPQITSLSAGPVNAADPGASGETPQFHPNGDGLEDELLIDHTVNRSAYLDAVVTNAAGETVKAYSVWSTGTSRSRWNGRNDAGLVVPDGLYTLTYTPRDLGGVTGEAASVQALVLTAAALPTPSSGAFYAADGDNLAKTTTFKVTLNQPAVVSWSIVNAAGETVRTVKSNSSTPAGTTSFAWNGKDAAGAWVPEGYYRSVVSAQTGLGSYTQQRSVFVGAFKISSSPASATRGGKITLNLISSEKLAKSPTVRITQPGIEPWSVTAKLVSGRTYKVTLTLKTGGPEGFADFLISGTDKNGGKQSSSLRLPLL